MSILHMKTLRLAIFYESLLSKAVLSTLKSEAAEGPHLSIHLQAFNVLESHQLCLMTHL